MKSKRFLSIALLAAAAALPAPASGQLYISDAEPFVKAVADRDGDKATSLLDSRPTLVNSRNAKGQTALNIAIARSDSTWTEFLLGRGADPNLQASNGDTPLITAARVGFTDAIELLLARGAKVDEDNKMGETPLIVAVQQRRLDAVKLLLSRGANPDKTDSASGRSARDYARLNTRDRQLLAAIEAVKKPGDAKKPNQAKKADDLDSFKLK